MDRFQSSGSRELFGIHRHFTIARFDLVHAAFEDDPAMDLGLQPQDGARKRGLAAAALADDGEHASARQVKRDVVHGAEGSRPAEAEEAAPVPIFDGEPGDLEEETGVRACARRRSRPPSGVGTDARGLAGEMTARRMVTGRQLHEGRPVRVAQVNSEGAAVGEDAVREAQWFFRRRPRNSARQATGGA